MIVTMFPEHTKYLPDDPGFLEEVMGIVGEDVDMVEWVYQGGVFFEGKLWGVFATKGGGGGDGWGCGEVGGGDGEGG